MLLLVLLLVLHIRDNHSFYFLIPGMFFTFLHQIKWFSLQFENKLSKFINDTSAATPGCCTSSIFFISQDHVIWLYTIFLMEISYSGRCKHLCIFSSKILLSPLKLRIWLLMAKSKEEIDATSTDRDLPEWISKEYRTAKMRLQAFIGDFILGVIEVSVVKNN